MPRSRIRLAFHPDHVSHQAVSVGNSAKFLQLWAQMLTDSIQRKRNFYPTRSSLDALSLYFNPNNYYYLH